MEAWLKERRPKLNGSEPKNGEEMSLSRVGKDLYEKVKNVRRSISPTFYEQLLIRFTPKSLVKGAE